MKKIIMNNIPETYPFPEDEILYCSAYDHFEPQKNSYIAVAKLPEEHTVEIDGKVHDNTHRLVIHSPVRGTETFMINPKMDSEGLLTAVLTIAGENENMGNIGEITINKRFFESKTGLDIEIIGEI